MYEACGDFFLFRLMRIQCKVLDEIKHLFGQFQTVYRNMAGIGSASPSIDFTNPPYFYRPFGTDQISNISQLHTQIDMTFSLCEHHSSIIQNCLYIIIGHSNSEIQIRIYGI